MLHLVTCGCGSQHLCQLDGLSEPEALQVSPTVCVAPRNSLCLAVLLLIYCYHLPPPSTLCSQCIPGRGPTLRPFPSVMIWYPCILILRRAQCPEAFHHHSHIAAQTLTLPRGLKIFHVSLVPPLLKPRKYTALCPVPPQIPVLLRLTNLAMSP